MIKIRFRDEFIKSFLKNREMSVQEFCVHCGITQEEYDELMSGKNYNLITIIKIGSFINLKVRHFFEEVK